MNIKRRSFAGIFKIKKMKNYNVKTMLRNALLMIAALVAFTACSNDDLKTQENKKTFVFVHGSWQGPFVWDAVKENLEKQGHKVVVVELPAHGQDQTQISAATLESYVSKVKQAVNAISGKVILIGHSMGGAVITQAGAQIPSKIEKLVYIAGYVPKNGQAIIELSSTDPDSQVQKALQFSPDMSTASITNPEINLKNIFCQDGTQTVIDKLVKNLRTEPTAPLLTPLSYDSAAYAKLDKYYIYTTEDRAIGYALQQKMAGDAQITKTFSIASGHSPFLSKPEKVCEIIVNIVR